MISGGEWRLSLLTTWEASPKIVQPCKDAFVGFALEVVIEVKLSEDSVHGLQCIPSAGGLALGAKYQLRDRAAPGSHWPLPQPDILIMCLYSTQIWTKPIITFILEIVFPWDLHYLRHLQRNSKNSKALSAWSVLSCKVTTLSNHFLPAGNIRIDNRINNLLIALFYIIFTHKPICFHLNFFKSHLNSFLFSPKVMSIKHWLSIHFCTATSLWCGWMISNLLNAAISLSNETPRETWPIATNVIFF